MNIIGQNPFEAPGNYDHPDFNYSEHNQAHSNQAPLNPYSPQSHHAAQPPAAPYITHPTQVSVPLYTPAPTQQNTSKVTYPDLLDLSSASSVPSAPPAIYSAPPAPPAPSTYAQYPTMSSSSSTAQASAYATQTQFAPRADGLDVLLPQLYDALDLLTNEKAALEATNTMLGQQLHQALQELQIAVNTLNARSLAPKQDSTLVDQLRSSLGHKDNQVSQQAREIAALKEQNAALNEQIAAQKTRIGTLESNIELIREDSQATAQMAANQIAELKTEITIFREQYRY